MLCKFREKQMSTFLNFFSFRSCGYYHTALVTEEGQLYVMGSNEDRQLGCSVSDKYSGPTKVSIPNKVTAVACGHQHTVVLTNIGEVYVCGMKEFFFFEELIEI